MRILFFPLITRGAALGTISRCLAIAEVLREQGHFAFFVTGGPTSRYVAESKFEYQEGPVPDPPGPLHPIRNLADVALFLNLTNKDYVRRSFEAELTAIDHFQPDAIFSEFKLTASISAACSGLPLASTACSPAHPGFVSPLFPKTGGIRDKAVAEFNCLLDEQGLSPVQDVAELFFMRSDLKIVPSSSELEPLLQDVENLYYVGYLLYDRWERAPLPPDLLKDAAAPLLVFAYFSVGEIGPDRYLQVLPKAFDHTEFHVVVAVGSHPQLPALPESTPNVKYIRFVPGSSILERSDALIFHGGQNTAMAALLHGVPSLIIPGSDFERNFNARSIARISAGIHMEADAFTSDQVLHATRRLLKGRYSQNAEVHGQYLKELGGPARAAELVLSAAK